MFEILQSVMIFLLKLLFNIYFFIFGQPKEDKYINQVAALYSGDDFISWFKKIRLWDSPLEEMNKVVPKKGLIIDLGCGDGVTSNYLALRSKTRKLIGFEIEKDRLKNADRGLKNTKFKISDATKTRLPQADCIICFHLLHHLLSFEAQEKLLKNCKASLKKNGKLIIVEIDIKPNLKFLTTWLTDHFLVPILFEKRLYSKIFFRRKKNWQKVFKNMNMKVKTINAEKGKPFSHIIFVATKI